jgi:hypothetical protein
MIHERLHTVQFRRRRVGGERDIRLRVARTHAFEERHGHHEITEHVRFQHEQAPGAERRQWRSRSAWADEPDGLLQPPADHVYPREPRVRAPAEHRRSERRQFLRAMLRYDHLCHQSHQSHQSPTRLERASGPPLWVRSDALVKPWRSHHKQLLRLSHAYDVCLTSATTRIWTYPKQERLRDQPLQHFQ